MGAHVFPHSEPCSHLPPSPIPWVVPEHQLWESCFMHPTCTGHLFYIWEYTCFNAILLNHPTLIFSHRVQKSVLYIHVSFAVSHIRSLLPSFQIPYIFMNTLYWCLSFWLSSLCIIGFNFIHLIRSDSNAFFLIVSNIPLCIFTTAFLSIRLLMDI